MIKVVAFDWNGVITDSLKFDHEIFLKECDRRGLKVTRSENFYANLFDDNVFDCFEKIGFHITDEYEELFRQNYLKGVGKIKPFPGAISMLKTLKKKYKLALITSNYRAPVDVFFKKHRMDGLFDIILTSDIDRRKENKIKILLEKLSISNEEVIFGGDTISDIKAAQRSGIKSMAIAWGYQRRAALKKANPDYIAGTPQEVIKILDEIDGKDERS